MYNKLKDNRNNEIRLEYSSRRSDFANSLQWLVIGKVKVIDCDQYALNSGLRFTELERL